ncbi:hypothetical protein PN498_10470 [Oscillatoria sp. CS-180]|nr:hypothetical protein [Oscillatoria sp. CS-180]MDB9526412.1 hypothetical protein [Oscillatoria sp. CS-180]
MSRPLRVFGFSHLGSSRFDNGNFHTKQPTGALSITLVIRPAALT